MDDEPGPSSGDRKRKRVGKPDSVSQFDNYVENDNGNGKDDDDDFISLETCLTFSDTLIALKMMRAQFPKLEKVSVLPFILRSQLYSSVNDRTQVDRDLETLKRDGVLRVFKLNSGQDDHAIMFLDDYIQQVDCVLKKMEPNKEGDFSVFGWFKRHVVTSKLEPSIAHQELWSLLSAGGKVKDDHISLLINAGVLNRQLIDPNMYWFAIPNIGSILKGLSQYSILHRSTYIFVIIINTSSSPLLTIPSSTSIVIINLHLTTSPPYQPATAGNNKQPTISTSPSRSLYRQQQQPSSVQPQVRAPPCIELHPDSHSSLDFHLGSSFSGHREPSPALSEHHCRPCCTAAATIAQSSVHLASIHVQPQPAAPPYSSLSRSLTTNSICPRPTVQ